MKQKVLSRHRLNTGWNHLHWLSWSCESPESRKIRGERTQRWEGGLPERELFFELSGNRDGDTWRHWDVTLYQPVPKGHAFPPIMGSSIIDYLFGWYFHRGNQFWNFFSTQESKTRWRFDVTFVLLGYGPSMPSRWASSGYWAQVVLRTQWKETVRKGSLLT